MSSKTALLLTSAILLLFIGCAHVQVVQTGTNLPGSPTPTPEAVVTPSDRTVTLAFTGDIMMGAAAADKLKTQGPDSFFLDTAPFLKQADIAMGNLEGPLGTKGIQVKHKTFTFLVDPSAALGLAHAGFKVLTLANNHTMDWGVDALQSTLEALDKQGLKHSGAGLTLAHARRPAWVTVKGRKVAILAYSLTLPVSFWATENHPGTAPARAEIMTEDIKAARAQGADIVVVCCHWGKEKHTKLEWYQPSLAHLAIESGADAVVCHHPHIWQGLEVYQGKPIAYAIGNFAFGSMSGAATVSGILYLSFNEKDQWTGGKIVPLNVHNSIVRFCPKPLDAKGAEKFMAYLHKLSKTADLSMDGCEITWKAPESNLKDVTPTPTLTPVPLQTPLPTPTAMIGDNPNGSLPGIQKH